MNGDPGAAAGTGPAPVGAATARVTLRFATASEASSAAASLAPDNGDHLRMRVEGAELHLEARAASLMGLLRTLDDALACLRATGMA